MNRASLLITGLMVAVFSTLVAGDLAAADADAAGKKRELEQVRQRIGKLQGELDSEVHKRDKATARLRDIERLLGSVRSNLARLQTERESGEARQAALQKEKRTRTALLSRQRGELGGHLRAAYQTGREERLKMLLNQHNAAALGRQAVYYRYFVDSRVEQIRQVEQHLAEIALIEKEVQRETEHLKSLEYKRSEELQSLETALGKRRDLLAKLERKISDHGSQLSRLQQQEQSLIRLLEELQRVLAEFPVQSQQAFTSLKGQLAWPVKGTVRGDFGAPRAGKELKWNGVLLEAKRGSYVRAVAHGRVAFADWLPGLGLLLVIEHGDGYLSLYGHNERLDKAAGDWVDAGEIIGTVGDSGGQPGPALYFEIRRGRTPLNPHPWFSRKLARS